MAVKLTRYARDGSQLDVLPTLILGYDVSQQSRTIVHQLIDGRVAATLLPASLRSGVLHLLFDSAGPAEAARTAHAGVGFWKLVDSGQAQEAMTYVVTGLVQKRQTDSRLTWLVDVPYQEIS